MTYILFIYKTLVLFLSICLQSNKVKSTNEGLSYFFYQQPIYPRDCKEARDQCVSDNISGVYTIKPDGYPHPFEVYCNNDIESGGWTVIQRQLDGSLTFRRNWKDYKKGFGFLSSEFWIGHEKLSYLTNQAVYELHIDIMLSNGSSFYLKYKSFRISDEWSDYRMVSAEMFRSNWSCIASTCPLNMTQGSCTCQDVCSDPTGQTECHIECEETCVPEGCFVTETDSYISIGESFINTDCTRNCTCVGNQLSCNDNYVCSTDATCRVKDELRKCYCNEGYEGDGETCIRNSFRDCYEAQQAGHTTDGVYTILPTGWPGGTPFTVFCDMTTDGGGWTVFQRRTDGVTDFYRDWNEYKQGFGSRDAGNDFWLGNDKIFYLTNQTENTLRVDLISSDGSSLYAKYSSFQIGDENEKYRMSIGSYSGNEANGMYYTDGTSFSTHDRDNDECDLHNYAEGHRGAWWYGNSTCEACYYSDTYCGYFETRASCNNIGTFANLNGVYNGGNGRNVYWPTHYDDDYVYYYSYSDFYFYYYCNLNSVEMKVRPSIGSDDSYSFSSS